MFFFISTKDSLRSVGGRTAVDRRRLMVYRRWLASNRQQLLTIRRTVEVQAYWSPPVLLFLGGALRTPLIQRAMLHPIKAHVCIWGGAFTLLEDAGCGWDPMLLLEATESFAGDEFHL